MRPLAQYDKASVQNIQVALALIFSSTFNASAQAGPADKPEKRRLITYQ